eukprot:TRINITY_DN20448_c0_g1_i2.p1 TRINITY_DN20448_c0_g1~~TRINITY_DN20448_c0_g1_i2.p1  ORF type:complete len:291 (-),score=14.93 TRINITY_DN20448_c0_g1_i2:94-966(-)
MPDAIATSLAPSHFPSTTHMSKEGLNSEEAEPGPSSKHINPHNADLHSAVDQPLISNIDTVTVVVPLEVTASLVASPREKKRKRGCSCNRSRCQKKYCECFNAGNKCTKDCQCTQCFNDGRPPKDRRLYTWVMPGGMESACSAIGVETAFRTDIRTNITSTPHPIADHIQQPATSTCEQYKSEATSQPWSGTSALTSLAQPRLQLCDDRIVLDDLEPPPVSPARDAHFYSDASLLDDHFLEWCSADVEEGGDGDPLGFFVTADDLRVVSGEFYPGKELSLIHISEPTRPY